MSAILKNHPNCAEFLLEKAASALCRDEEGWTVMHAASRRGFPELLQAMISALPPDYTSIDILGAPYGCTRLISAACGRSLGCVEVLLANGASDLERDIHSTTAAYIAAHHGRSDVLLSFLWRTPWQKFDPNNASSALVGGRVRRGPVEIVHDLLGLGTPMVHKVVIRRNGVTVHWSWLGALIENKAADPLPMARFLSELYANHIQIGCRRKYAGEL